MQLKQCAIEKKEDQLVLDILSKLGPDYSTFLLTFHATNLTARSWKIPKLAEFMESLAQEQDKLVMMDTIKPSKDQALVVGDLRVDSEGKKKDKNPPKQKRYKNKFPKKPQGSKKNPQNKKNKGEMRKCTYCSKGNHSESSRMKKKIDMLTQLLENNGISLPNSSKKRKGGSNSEDRERVHALVAGIQIERCHLGG